MTSTIDFNSNDIQYISIMMKFTFIVRCGVSHLKDDNYGVENCGNNVNDNYNNTRNVAHGYVSAACRCVVVI